MLVPYIGDSSDKGDVGQVSNVGAVGHSRNTLVMLVPYSYCRCDLIITLWLTLVICFRIWVTDSSNGLSDQQEY